MHSRSFGFPPWLCCWPYKCKDIMGDSVQVAAIIHRQNKKRVFMYGGTFKEASKKANEDHCRKRQTLNCALHPYLVHYFDSSQPANLAGRPVLTPLAGRPVWGNLDGRPAWENLAGRPPCDTLAGRLIWDTLAAWPQAATWWQKKSSFNKEEFFLRRFSFQKKQDFKKKSFAIQKEEFLENRTRV